MITYTVFDPDDATGLTYRWFGGGDTTVYVHNEGVEHDAFELTDLGEPTRESVAAAVAAFHDERRADFVPEHVPIEE